MSGERDSASESDVAVYEVPPVRELAFSMLTLLVETAAMQLRVDLPMAAESPSPQPSGAPNIGEARAAIDAANALLAAVRTIMENDALRAIEGMLTQLQIEYVHRTSRSS